MTAVLDGLLEEFGIVHFEIGTGDTVYWTCLEDGRRLKEQRHSY